MTDSTPRDKVSINDRVTNEALVDRIKKSDRIMIFLTIIIAASAAFSSYITYGQLEEMRETGKQMEQSIEAAKIQAKAATSFSTSAEGINAQTKVAVEQFHRMADASEETIQASLKSFREDQRAWVGIANASLQPLEIDKPFSFSVILHNSGKTFAKHVVVKFYLSFAPGAQTELPKADEPKEKSIGVLVPGGRYNNTYHGGKVRSVDKDLITGTWYTYIWGEVSYRDVFDRPHSTHFCFYRKGVEGDFLQSSFHNDAN